jgi:hypothetical protein
MDSAFEKFWKDYPAKSAEFKAEAFKRAIASGARQRDILLGAQRYARQMKSEGREPRYIKSPANWLDDGCWNDESTPRRRGRVPPGDTRAMVL